VKEHDRIEVFYDGACPLCSASRRWAEERDRDGRFAFRDLNEPVAGGCLPAVPGGPGDAMWVRLPGGETLSGYAGWLAVLRALPRWRLLGRVMGLPPVRWAGRRVYRFVAHHRHALVRR
jgi:predicted DCC family thiol-disulfide oxidoreductase YuxK